jgi:HPt (histidine-containing phosphotransfer) domain-containing protein
MANSESSQSIEKTVDIAWDEDRTIKRMGGQKALIEKLVTLFLRDAPEQIQQALQGIEEHDYDCSHIAVHSLKGTSSNFCTKRLEAVCAELLIALKERDWQKASVIHHELADEYTKLERQFQNFLK